MDGVFKIIDFLLSSGWSLPVSGIIQECYTESHYDMVSRTLSSHPFQWIGNIQEHRRKGHRYPFHLLQYYAFSTTYCFDPRDKIYATISLAAELTSDDDANFGVDYSEAVTQTFIRASRRCLEVSQSLELLSITAHPKGESHAGLQLPSWCPNYSSNDYYHRRPHPLDLQPDHSRSPKIFQASRNSLYLADDAAPKSPLLKVRGMLGGQIVAVGTELKSFKWKVFSGLLDLLVGLEIPPGHSRVEMFWRTLVHDMYDRSNANQPHPAASDTIDCFFNLFYLMLNSELLGGADVEQYREVACKITSLWQLDPDACRIFPDVEQYLALGPEVLTDPSFWDADMVRYPLHDDHMVATSLMYNIMSKTFQRRVFRTTDQRLGMGFETMQAGDEVWLLAGGRVPYVLRPLDNGNYEFHGEAYVHGIMMGEAWPEDEGELVDIVLE